METARGALEEAGVAVVPDTDAWDPGEVDSAAWEGLAAVMHDPVDRMGLQVAAAFAGSVILPGDHRSSCYQRQVAAALVQVEGSVRVRPIVGPAGHPTR